MGLAALLIGGFAGGAVARACRSRRALWLGAFLQMFSNLAFVWLGYQPPSAGALTVAIIVENFTGAIGTVIFVAYISALCRNPLHTATQYALLTALASTGRTLLSSGTGFVVAGHRLAAVLPRHRRSPRCRRWRCWPGCSGAGILWGWVPGEMRPGDPSPLGKGRRGHTDWRAMST